MHHYLLNVTWKCQNNCPECWMQNTVGRRPEMLSAAERPLRDWLYAIERDKPELVDIAGGEPLLVPWATMLIQECPDTLFGLSTNGLAARGLAQLVRACPRNLIAINVSYHPRAVETHPDYEERYRKAVAMLLQAPGRPHVNVVDYEDNWERSTPMREWRDARGVKVVRSPFETVDDLGEFTDTALCCQGGVNHLTVAPDGKAWPCLTALRSPYWKDLCLGNWLDGDIDLARKPQPCHLKCVDYYVLPKLHESGDMWRIEAKPCAS